MGSASRTGWHALAADEKAIDHGLGEQAGERRHVTREDSPACDRQEDGVWARRAAGDRQVFERHRRTQIDHAHAMARQMPGHDSKAELVVFIRETRGHDSGRVCVQRLSGVKELSLIHISEPTRPY